MTRRFRQLAWKTLDAARLAVQARSMPPTSVSPRPPLRAPATALAVLQATTMSEAVVALFAEASPLDQRARNFAFAPAEEGIAELAEAITALPPARQLQAVRYLARLAELIDEGALTYWGY